MNEENIKKEIMEKIKEYYELSFKKNSCDSNKIPASSKFFDEKELQSATEAVLDGWWTSGRFVKTFNKKFSEFLGIRYSLLTNSGSSSNLLALTALTSPLIEEEKRLEPGDEVITVAAGFPTTISPIIQNRCIPVFVDTELETYNACTKEIKDAITKKTKVVFLAHTLGNPFEIDEIKKLCEEHNLWLIEDCCDALGSEYGQRIVGTFGDLATFSFYPAHHITMGEGGAVVTNNQLLKKIVLSLRDWGRDCRCEPGYDATCKKRFSEKYADLPQGYDHKYVYSHLGYNLKLTDIQAAIGLAQLKKIDFFIEKRKENFYELKKGLEHLQNKFILPKPTHNSDPSWFGFPITLKNGERKELIQYLETNNIGTRLLFAGNITKQPCFLNRQLTFRINKKLRNTDKIMDSTFWIGVHPKIGSVELEYIIDIFNKYY